MPKQKKLDEGLLWYRTIDPMCGKIVREETFLGAAVAGIVLIAGIATIIWLAQFL